MRKFFAIGVVVLGLAMVGCNAKPSLVGKWKGEISAQGQSMAAEIEFKGDGKMVSDVTMNGIKLQILGSYTIKDESYTATMEDIKIISLPKEMEQVRSVVEQGIQKQKGTTQTTKFKFKDAESVEMTASTGETSVWTRQK